MQASTLRHENNSRCVNENFLNMPVVRWDVGNMLTHHKEWKDMGTTAPQKSSCLHTEHHKTCDGFFSLKKDAMHVSLMSWPQDWPRSECAHFYMLSEWSHLSVLFHASPASVAARRVKPGLMDPGVSLFLRNPSTQ